MFNWLGLVQIVIIAIVMWLFYRTFIRNSASEKLVHGLFGLAALWVLSFVMSFAGLDLLAGFFHWTALFLSVGLVVIFQPELRKFLALMGNMKLIRAMFSSAVLSRMDEDKIHKSVNEIITAVEYMSAKHTGALIVFQDKFDDGAITKKGTKIDGIISSELLLTVFFNKTALHDGAMIIDNNRILSAGAILPLSQNNFNWKFGTRHRAAIGLSEISKSVILVVSEETGDVSIAEKGKITKFDDMKKLKTKLEKVMKS